MNRPEHSGIATAVVNVVVFPGTGLLQPAARALLDRERPGAISPRRGTAA